MTNRYDRRAFLRRVTALGVLGPSVRVLACVPDGGAPCERAGGPDPRAITRPVLHAWGAGAVRIDAPALELPVAYVSRRAQRVFVDHEFRRRSAVLLAAHISVSSGLWRIPLLGDDLDVPIPADDALREFEEVDVAEWSAEGDPMEGDYRIRRGRRAEVLVNFACAPLAGGGAWLSAGPFGVVHCVEQGEEPCLEVFRRVGSATRFGRRYCSESGAEVPLFTWACPDP